ncbi:MAG: nucleotidyltransferase domain-containing protein [Candidatus Helarchaeales archaeon]
MPREKVLPNYFEEEVVYSKEHWSLFRKLREKTKKILSALKNFNAATHGSIARGDITPQSDIDIIILDKVDEFELVRPLDLIGYHEFQERYLIQATPLSAIKGTIVLEKNISITFPLIAFYPRERDFYAFGGILSIQDAFKDARVPGINKQLLFIEPTAGGHLAWRVTEENAAIASKRLGINIHTILERLRVLERRDRVGRTGIFLKRALSPDESFGEVLRNIERKNPASRRRIRRKKI